MKLISMVGCLPPWKGISQYTTGLVVEMDAYVPVQFFGFSSLYPAALYPGGSPKDTTQQTPTLTQSKLTRTLQRWNPLSRLWTGFSLRGELLHMQYWIWFLAPIYLTIGTIAKYARRIPVVVTVHNVQPHEHAWWKSWMDRWVYRIADELIVHSTDNAQHLQRLFPDKHIAVFPHGMIEHGHEKIAIEAAREQLSVPKEKKLLLFFGAIRLYKGLSLLLESLALLDESYHLLIVGKPREDWSHYEQLLAEKNLQDRVSLFLGYADDLLIQQAFSASDLLVLPYREFTAQSGVVALGLSYEIPMVVADLGGLTEVIDDERYICKTYTPACLAATITQTFEPENYADGQQLIVRKKETLSWEYIVPRLLTYYQQVSGR